MREIIEGMPSDCVHPLCKEIPISSNNTKTYENFLTELGISIDRIIGEGSYSKVRRMCWLNGRKLALKVIDSEKISEAVRTKFVPRELGNHRRLKHENIVRIEDVYLIGPRIFICMEFMENGDLLNYIQVKSHLSESEAQSIFRQIVSAVNYCHYQEIAHRDLKCENILLDQKLNVKITDFGFSRLCSE
ncbi:hypothetical protein ACOME3_007741 [Neoechinorhynchus agilis]